MSTSPQNTDSGTGVVPHQGRSMWWAESAAGNPHLEAVRRYLAGLGHLH